jgi:nitroreductase
MDFIELAQSRRSIRNFTQERVTDEDLERLLVAAQSAPSAGNCQPWHFYVTTDKAIKDGLTERAYCQGFISAAPAVIVVCADIKRSEAKYGSRGRSLYCLQDTAAAVQNILLCAAGMGLGTCWIGAFEEDKVWEFLGLAKDMRPVAIIPIGYPEQTPPPRGRRPLSEIATFI